MKIKLNKYLEYLYFKNRWFSLILNTLQLQYVVLYVRKLLNIMICIKSFVVINLLTVYFQLCMISMIKSNFYVQYWLFIRRLMYWQLQYEIENKIKKGHAFFGNLGKYFDTHGTCTKPVKPIILCINIKFFRWT